MTTAPAQDPLIGQILDGRYRIEEQVGHGGMGSVYRAWHTMMERRVAIKVLAEERAEDPTYAKRFVREAKSTFRFDHPNCVRVTDFNATSEGVLYIVMEYLDGRTVGQELHYDGPMQPDRIAHIGHQVCEALGHAHALGFVHRDLKPDNIMLVRRQEDADFVKVLDFGLAKFVDEGGLLKTKMSISPLTQAGMVFGTPEYMSPEQASGKKLSGRTDLYSFGVVVYQMLTGQVPFVGASFMQILTKHVKEIPVSPAQRRPDLKIPDALDRIVMWCMEKQPSKRPQSAEALSTAFFEAHAELSRSHSRIPTKVAASETMDLGSDPLALSGPSTSPQSPGALAERTSVDMTAPEIEPPPDDDEKTTLPREAAAPSITTYVRATSASLDAPAAPHMTESEPLASDATPGRRVASQWNPRSAAVVAHGPPGVTQMHVRRHRAIAVTAVAIVFGAVAGVSAFLMTRDRPGSTAAARTDSGARADAPAIAATRPDATAVAGDPLDAGRTTSQHDASAAPDIDASVPRPATRADAAVQVVQKPPDPPDKKTAAQKQAEIHVRNARSAPNDLKALAEAQTAYKLDPKNREARILFGELLIKTDQKARGCRLLERYRRRWQRAGCAN